MRANQARELPAATAPRALRLRWNIELAGLRVGRDRIVEVVDSLPPEQLETERDVVTAAEADALLELGCADAVHTATIIRFPELW